MNRANINSSITPLQLYLNCIPTVIPAASKTPDID
jgi:hypothetical protein